MDYSFAGSKVFTEKEKKIYTTLSGVKLDLTWRPSIIDKYYKEYVDAKYELTVGYQKFSDTLTALKSGTPDEADIMKKYLADIDNFKNIGYKIILAAFKANKQDYDETFIDTSLTSEEKELVIFIIMDIANEQFNLPATPSNKKK